MTSKERVLAAFARTEPDRVPINFASNPGVDRGLAEHFGCEVGELLEVLDIDFRSTGAPYTGPVLHTIDNDDWIVDGQWGIRRRFIENPSGGYWDFCDFPMKDGEEELVRNWPMPSPDDYDYGCVANHCRAVSDKAVYVGGAGLGDIINNSGMLWTMEETLVRMMMKDELFLHFVDRRGAVGLEVTRRCIEAADGGVDFVWIGEDLGTQEGAMIGLDLFREVIRPRMQQLVDLAKSFDLPVIIHSCGSSSWAFDDFVEMGIDVVDTLQPEAANMAPEYLKERWGDKLAFHGCISTAGPVAYGTVQDVIDDCREKLESMKPGGGYCFAPTHQLQENSPTENVVAMYDAAREFGGYL